MLVYKTRREEAIFSLVSSTLAHQGFSIVKVCSTSIGTRIMIDHADGITPITLEDCTKVTRAVIGILSVEAPAIAKQGIEVSSPGVNRPLTRAEDFKRFMGRKAIITLTRSTCIDVSISSSECDQQTHNERAICNEGASRINGSKIRCTIVEVKSKGIDVAFEPRKTTTSTKNNQEIKMLFIPFNDITDASLLFEFDKQTKGGRKTRQKADGYITTEV